MKQINENVNQFRNTCLQWYVCTIRGSWINFGISDQFCFYMIFLIKIISFVFVWFVQYFQFSTQMLENDHKQHKRTSRSSICKTYKFWQSKWRKALVNVSTSCSLRRGDILRNRDIRFFLIFGQYVPHKFFCKSTT